MKCLYCQAQNSMNHQILGFDLCYGCANKLTNGTNHVAQKHVYIYLRVSTKQQSTDDTSGLFIQRRQCIEYCISHEFHCDGIYEDVHSAFHLQNRGLSEFHQMLEDLGYEIYIPSQCHSKIPLVSRLRTAMRQAEQFLLLETEDVPNNHIDAIVVANIDRLGRDISNMMIIKKQLAVHNTNIISVCQSFATDNAIGEMSFSRGALESELFSRDRSYRIKSVKQAKKALGNYLGGVSKFGFQVKKLNGIRKVITHPVEQIALNKIMNLRKYCRPSLIAQKLNNQKLFHRMKPWTSGAVARIIKREMQDNSMDVDELEHDELENMIVQCEYIDINQ